MAQFYVFITCTVKLLTHIFTTKQLK